MLQTQKLELKKELYLKNDYSLIKDSLKGVINIDFQSIDNEQYYFIKKMLHSQKKRKPQKETGRRGRFKSKREELLKKLYAGQKINLRGF